MWILVGVKVRSEGSVLTLAGVKVRSEGSVLSTNLVAFLRWRIHALIRKPIDTS